LLASAIYRISLALDLPGLGASLAGVKLSLYLVSHLSVHKVNTWFNCVVLLLWTPSLLRDMKFADQRLLGDNLLLPVSLDFT